MVTFKTKELRSGIQYFSFCFFLLTAFFSIGYYHGDEHYQIIEFAGLKLGTHQPHELAWEFKEKLRSAFLPSLAFVQISIYKYLGVHDPYAQMKIIRIITALFSFTGITIFIRKTEALLDQPQLKLFYSFFSYLLWFIPFLAVRYSSETWSGIFFLIGLSFLISETSKTTSTFWVGVFFGLSFVCRYQMGIGVASVVIWLIVIKQYSLRELLKPLLGIIIITLLGIALDSWFYGEFTISWLYYFKATLLAAGEQDFGSSPWYFYLKQLLFYPNVVVGILMITSFILLLTKKPKSVLIWIWIPFIAVHSLIPHKEERFIFPIAFTVALIISLGVEVSLFYLKKYKYAKTFLLSIGISFLMVNFVALFALSFKPAGIGRMAISKYLHDNYGNHSINLIYCSWASPYDPWHGLNAKFYLEKDYRGYRISNLCELNDSLIDSSRKTFLAIRRVDLKVTDCEKNIESLGFKLVKESTPSWVASLNNYYKGYDNEVIIMLFSRESNDKN